MSSSRHDERAVDDVLELAHVARPVVRSQALEGARRVKLLARLVAPRLLSCGEEVLGQELDVLPALAQRRQVDREHVQPIEQVLAQLALRATASSGRRLVAAMTRTSTLIGSSPPTRVTCPSRARAAACTCSSTGISVISSRNSVPPVRALEVALVHAVRAREAAALVAEELALDQVRRHGAAVDRQERVACGGGSAAWIVCATSSLPRAGLARAAARWRRWARPCAIRS